MKSNHYNGLDKNRDTEKENETAIWFFPKAVWLLGGGGGGGKVPIH